MNAWWLLFWLAAALLAYMLVGYNALLLFLAKMFGRRDRTAPITPTVTLIVPAYNEEKVIRAKLENALRLDYPRELLEILVASDGSTDETIEIARSFESQGVKVLDFCERRGKASVLNDAVEAASGEVLLLCDANVMFHADALRRLVGHLADPRVGAVTGRVELASEESNFGEGESFYYTLERAIQKAESDVGSLMGVDGGMYVIRKDMFQPLPADTILDDFVLSMRVVRQGRHIVYDPECRADENGTPQAKQEFRRRIRMAAGTVQILKRGDFPRLTQPVLLWQFVSHKLLRWMGPLLLLSLFVGNLALVRAGWFYQVALGAQVAIYLWSFLAAVYIPLRRTRLGGIPFYFVMGHAGIAVGLVTGVLNRQRVTWQKADRVSLHGQGTGASV